MSYTAAQKALKAYSQIRNGTEVEGADAHRLVALLMDGALERIGRAKAFMVARDIPRKGEQIGMAVSVIEGLRAALDRERGGAIADNLEALYDYMLRRLTEANLRNDPAILDEVAGLLREIKGAWEAIREAALQPAQRPAARVAP
ncbi:MAG: flagellar export chaperone FliS [Gammaproteobacteria bacterium]|nr:MAG: flagellar export chaperone FliS [Gammaproteobacteria bacterium]